jgi:hypothetical protein
VDRTKYLAATVERERACAADVMATGRRRDLAERMLELVLESGIESALRQRVVVDKWPASNSRETERREP